MYARLHAIAMRGTSHYKLNVILWSVHPCLFTLLQKQSYLSMETSLGVAALLPFRDDPIAINPSLLPPLDNYYPIPSTVWYSESSSRFKSVSPLSAVLWTQNIVKWKTYGRGVNHDVVQTLQTWLAFRSKAGDKPIVVKKCCKDHNSSSKMARKSTSLRFCDTDIGHLVIITLNFHWCYSTSNECFIRRLLRK
jgi:hypothetical protein